MTMQRTTRPTSRGCLAFTLIELIVAIGAVALISVGIAAVFESIGRTVQGGRRVSVLNQYAALIERQMRADFEAMTREGVLVVRHSYADTNGDGRITEPEDHVAQYPDQPAPEQRLRRIDELLFFARGEYSSARTPVLPGMTARSSEAMIYYGQGERLDPLTDRTGKSLGGGYLRYDRPQVDDGSTRRPYRPELALGASVKDPTNPNRYASDWSLLRLVTVLAPPSSSEQNLPSGDPQFWNDIGLDPAEALDNAIQVGGQPAASSAFRTLAQLFPTGGASGYPFPPDYIRQRGDGARGRHPMLASGIVDVAAADLADLRRMIMDVKRFPWDIQNETELFDPANPANSLFDDRYQGTFKGDLRYMHAWMDDLFPTDPTTGMRVRYEDVMPDFVGTLSTYSDAKTRNFRFIQSFRLADQRMLGSSIFVPHCTEFIVDYSFGQVVDSPPNSPYLGQLIWYGLDRTVTIDGATVTVVRPYPYDTTSSRNTRYSLPYTRLDGSAASKDLDPTLIYEVLSGGPIEPLTAHFGYTDPTYTPVDVDKDPATIPWPWPKLIRVTMTLADPSDPSIEQSFQFIFETPDGRQF